MEKVRDAKCLHGMNLIETTRNARFFLQKEDYRMEVSRDTTRIDNPSLLQKDFAFNQTRIAKTNNRGQNMLKNDEILPIGNPFKKFSR